MNPCMTRIMIKVSLNREAAAEPEAAREHKGGKI